MLSGRIAYAGRRTGVDSPKRATQNSSTVDWADALDNFRTRYSPRSPDLTRLAAPSELRVVPVELLVVAPQESASQGTPPRSRDDYGAGRYLWVIDHRGVPYLLEQPMAECDGSMPKHTNVTGGEPAWIGGEVWFAGPSNLFVSGGSGRYPPDSAGHLESAVDVFRAHLYAVTSLGWDHETESARRFYATDDRKLG